MNGRTCQLCGKALGRFSGSGGDFCSREHRNQFRLRLGMDRLEEANKVASLMRRRENAKVIPAAQLARDLDILPRVAPLLRMPVHQANIRPLRPLRPALSTPAIVSHSEHLRPAIYPASIEAKVRSSEPQAFPIPPRVLPTPPRRQGFVARIAPAGAVFARFAGTRVAHLRREVTELRLILCRTHFGGSGIQVPPLLLPPQHCQEPQPARRLNNSADRGRDLRVSGGIGFRLKAPRVRSVKFARPRTNPPVRATDARGLTSCSQQMNSSALTAGVIRFTVRVPSAPRGPKQNNVTVFQWPNTPLNGAAEAWDGVALTRNCDVKWSAPPPRLPQLRQGTGPLQFRVETPSAPTLEARPAQDMQSTRRLTAVSFQPQETPFQCPSDLHGTLLSGMHFGTAPVRKVDSAPATLEEHFDAGLHNWVGGIEDWKVDVAGVRPGSLALYSPSLDIANYVLEFLIRIELRGVSWVFRAANYNDYYQATLSVAPGGGYEFRRQTVVGGSAEEATVRVVPPAQPAASGKTAVTVRTRVAGNEFTISLDGQKIDTWTDSRLTGGGIGFIGAPEERARLYWVKVTPIGHTTKEYSKR